MLDKEIKKSCVGCQKTFQTRKENKIFCSSKCRVDKHNFKNNFTNSQKLKQYDKLVSSKPIAGNTVAKFIATAANELAKEYRVPSATINEKLKSIFNAVRAE